MLWLLHGALPLEPLLLPFLTPFELAHKLASYEKKASSQID